MRRGEEVLLVQQAAAGEEPFWALPGGLCEQGEDLTEALAREVREETGLEFIETPRLAYAVQVDSRRADSGGPLSIWTFEVVRWRGEVAPDDPSGLVFDACFLPIEEAAERLESTPWLSLSARYLRGEVPRGSLHFERWHADGRVELV